MDTAEIESPESDEDSWTLAPSLFDVGMPGIMTVEEVEDDIDLGETKIQTEKGVYYAKVWAGPCSYYVSPNVNCAHSKSSNSRDGRGPPRLIPTAPRVPLQSCLQR